MVLVDTSVWVSHLREENGDLAELLQMSKVVVHPFIIGELACGYLKNRREILSLLQALPGTPIVSQSEFLSFIEHHSLIGHGIGFVDVHLLASARLIGASLWTIDRRLKRAAVGLRLS